jgi:CMP-N-acetylneuraminic acid synthetase
VIYFVIPARKGSKGFPGKNRKLFKYTYNSIPVDLRNKCIVTSDDDVILSFAEGMIQHKRSELLSDDLSPIKDVLIDVSAKKIRKHIKSY